MEGKKSPRVLYLSGSVGMGHVTRDMAIASELRKIRPDIELEWLGGEPAASVLKDAGETVIPEANGFSGEIDTLESMTNGYRLNLARYLVGANTDWKDSFGKYLRIVEKGNYDLVVGDEAYEVITGYMGDLSTKKVPFVMMFDFAKDAQVTRNPKDMMIIWMMNHYWQKGKKLVDKGTAAADSLLFIGEREDVPDERLGLFMMNARKAAESYEYVGYALPFDPKELMDVAAQKKKLGYGTEKLILCTIGGTSVGKDLLELCGLAYPLIKEKIPDAKMVMVTGPRLDPGSIKVPEGVEVRGYIPELYQHMAACDLAIVQAGGTTTIELTALKRPFLYFPLEEHFEQLGTVVPRLHRHRAGVEMHFYQTSPERLAEAVVQNLSKKCDYADIPVEGARNAARIIAKLLPAK